MSDQYSALYSSYHWLVPTQFNIANMCLHRWAENPAHMRRAAMHHVTADSARAWSYGDLRDVSNRLANGLIKMGIGKGDRVAVIMPFRPESVAACLAVMGVGAIVLPLSPRLGIDALSLRLSDAGARCIIADTEIAADLPVIMKRCPCVRQLIGLEFENDDTLSWRTLIARESTQFKAVNSRADDPALLIYTPGTTGRPKGVLHAHRVLIGVLPAFVAAQNWYPRDADLFWSSIDWTSACGFLHGVMTVLYFGNSLVSMSERRGPEATWALLSQLPITHGLMLTSDLQALKAARDIHARGPVSLRALMVVGETLHEDLHEWVKENLGTSPNEVYGLTEAPGLIGHSAEKWPNRAGSMGRPIPGHRIRLLDSKGQSIKRGAVGQIALNVHDPQGHPDPCLFLGYWNNEALTSSRYRDGWFLTGDMASIDEDGYLWFIARADDMFRAGGYSISPLEIEECLQAHPAVEQAAVVPKPLPSGACEIKAFIVLRSEASPVPTTGGPPQRAREPVTHVAALEEQLRQHVRRKLSSWQIPQEIEFVDYLPTAADGQIRRHVLRAREQQLCDLMHRDAKSD